MCIDAVALTVTSARQYRHLLASSAIHPTGFHDLPPRLSIVVDQPEQLLIIIAESACPTPFGPVIRHGTFVTLFVDTTISVI